MGRRGILFRGQLLEALTLTARKERSMRHISTTIVLAVVTLLFVSICEAQQTSTTAVPNLIRYGGTLKDGNGAPIATTTGVTFAIYKQQDGGATIWLETQNVAPDTSGQYSVLLGSTTATGLPSDLFSQEEQRWLGVQVQGQAEQPRVLLVSVPYAFKAHEAETLGGKSVSDFVLANDLNSTQTGSVAGSGQATTATSGNAQPDQCCLPPTDFRGSTTDQIVKVTQDGTGNAIVASTFTSGVSHGVLAGIRGPGVAIFGQAYSPSAQAYGVEGSTASTIGIGVAGLAYAGTGPTYGLAGYSSSSEGTGTRGLSTATTGTTYGVSGQVSSRNGTGVWGQANTLQGGTGVWGQSLASEGPAVGVRAEAASTVGTSIVATEISPTGTTYGLNALVESPHGTAAWLQNTAGGPLIRATTGPSRSPVTKFSVDGNGNVTGLGTLAGNAINSATNYQIGGQTILSEGNSDGDVFLGAGAGSNNVPGPAYYNTFLGASAGNLNTTGNSNTFTGFVAGVQNTTGSYNLFYGIFAGVNNTTGSNNIYIGNEGTGAENSTIRIGGDDESGYGAQTAAFIAGIYGSTSSGGVPVYINSDGHLGTLTSSRRFKEQIADMGGSSSRLFQLRPVTFFYKPQYDDGSGPLQYGLIAEEVAKVYPEMVAYDKDGQPYTVKYQYLAPMLLNELQKQHTVVAAQQDVIKMQQEQIKEMQQRLSRLESLIPTPR